MTDTPRTDALQGFCPAGDVWLNNGKELERELAKMTSRALAAERYANDMLQDTYEGAYVPTTLRDALVQALSEVAPDHPALKAKPPSYGVWQMLRLRLNEVTKERDELLKALRDLIPFVLDDYYPNCATPDYKSAVEAAKKVCNEP